MNTSRFVAWGPAPERILIGVVVASCLAACSQSGSAQRNVERQSQGIAAQLDPQSCISEALGCTGDASTQSELASCQQGLQACLAATMAEAGLPAFPTFPDAGLPTLLDAGVIRFGTF
jgi:hypothetical protein